MNLQSVILSLLITIEIFPWTLAGLTQYYIILDDRETCRSPTNSDTTDITIEISQLTSTIIAVDKQNAVAFSHGYINGVESVELLPVSPSIYLQPVVRYSITGFSKVTLIPYKNIMLTIWHEGDNEEIKVTRCGEELAPILSG